MPDLERIHRTAAAFDALMVRKPPPSMREIHESRAAMGRALRDEPEPEPIKIPTAEEIKAMREKLSKPVGTPAETKEV